MMKLAIIFSVFILSCSQHNSVKKRFEKIKQAERIFIDYSSNLVKDTIVNADTTLLNLFEEVLENKQEPCSCPVTGEVIFYSKNSTQLKIEFAAHETDKTNGRDCEFLILNDEGKRKCYRMTYELGMYLGFYMINEKK